MSDRIIKQQQKEEHFNRGEERIYNILINKVKYKPNYFKETDLNPHLILKLKVPSQEYIPRDDFIELSKYVSFPSKELERAFHKAQRKIIQEMNYNKQNTDPSKLRIRLQQTLVPIPLLVKQTKLLNEYEEEQPLQIQSIYKNQGVLDCFGIQYNAIVYILQEVCGFSLKAFLLYDEQGNKDIFMFLTLRPENFLNLAKKYRIKKEVDYSFIDFFMNDPFLSDKRPIKFLSDIKSDGGMSKQVKSMNRYFKVGNNLHETTQISEELQVKDKEKQRFRDYMQDLQHLYDYEKYKKRNIISNQEKAYIYQYNRCKINKGCEKMYAMVKKRREVFQINKQILRKHGYKFHEEPLVYQQFVLMDSKHMSFFDKLYSLLLYQPQVVNERGDLDLFLNMEKIKLSYLTIKHNFKINYLKKIGFEFLALNDDYEKFGSGGGGGGINGKSLEQQWSLFFLNANTVRSYMGDSIAFQILINNKLIGYFMSIVFPFVTLYVIEYVYQEQSYIYTTFAETLIYAVSFQVFLLFWEQEEKEFIMNYTDERSSKIFLSTYRGPYIRNPVTDELNEFESEGGLVSGIKNAICGIIIGTLLVVMGAIFYGCRSLLLAITEPLHSFSTTGFSLPHVISYLIFFFIVDLLALLATDRIIRLLVRLQNPPTDEEESQWVETLTFFYLFGLELVPPAFFLFLEPFNDTSCYADSCISEIELYVYSRIIITFLVSIARFSYIFFFNYLKSRQEHRKEHAQFYQDKLASLLHRALRESKKSEYFANNNETIIVTISYSIYTNVSPLISSLALVAMLIFVTSSRLVLLYEARRPINRSERLIEFTPTVRSIFYVGLFAQAWITIFSLQFVEDYMQGAIKIFLTNVTYQGLFLMKFFLLILYVLALVILAQVSKLVAEGFTNNVLFHRKNNKFKEYMQSRGRLKAQLRKLSEVAPIKSIFRTFHPKKLDLEVVNDQLYNEDYRKRARSEESEHSEQAVKELGSALKLSVSKLN